MKHPKKFLSFGLKFTLTFLILYWVLRSVPLHDYSRAFTLLTIKPIIIVLLLGLLQVFLLAYRWNLLATAAGSKLTLKFSIFGILMSLFFSQGLPASVGGDAFRIWWHRRENIATGTALKIIFFDRIYGLLSLVLLCIVGLYMLDQLLGGTKLLPMMMLVFSMGIAMAALIMPWRLGISKRLDALSLYFPAKIAKTLQWLTTTRHALSEQKFTTVSKLFTLGVMIHLLVVIQVFVIGSSLEPQKFNLLMCLTAVPLALLVSYMPFSIAGWGVREASMVVAFAFLGVKAATAIVISVVIGMVMLAISLLGGMLWISGGFRNAYAQSALAMNSK